MADMISVLTQQVVGQLIYLAGCLYEVGGNDSSPQNQS